MKKTHKVLTTFSGVDVATRQIEVLAVASEYPIREYKDFTLVQKTKDKKMYYAIFYRMVGTSTLAQKIKYWVRGKLGMHEPITAEKVITL